jgi:molybdopterin converting factor subunit 1
MIKIQIRSFAQLREKMGSSSLAFELPIGSTLTDCSLALLKAYPKLSQELSQIRWAVNQEYARDMTLVLNAGDEVALIPPVSGG